MVTTITYRTPNKLDVFVINKTFKIHNILIYLRGLEIAELKEEDMPMV